MPLMNQNEIKAQEKLFRKHSSEFFVLRSENSQYTEQCIDLLRGHFSEKLAPPHPAPDFPKEGVICKSVPDSNDVLMVQFNENPVPFQV